MTSKTVTTDVSAAKSPAVGTLAVTAPLPGDAGGEARDLGSVPLEWLETELTSMAASIAAATAQWLAWLGPQRGLCDVGVS